MLLFCHFAPRNTLLIALMLAPGCATGGGRDGDAGGDSSIRLFDSGQALDDGAITGADSGMPGTDSGMPRRDAGMTGTCPESPCQLIEPQCGCPSGQGCYLDTNSDRTCGAVGTLTEGEACFGDGECRAGDQCVDIGDEAMCFHYCDDDGDCTGPGSVCLGGVTDSDGVFSTLCTPSCDPVDDIGCGAFGSGCTIGMDGGRHFTLCRPEGSGFAGDFCSDEEDCFGGHFCGGGSCVQYCRDDFDCLGFDDICAGFDPPIIIDGDEYGGCR